MKLRLEKYYFVIIIFWLFISKNEYSDLLNLIRKNRIKTFLKVEINMNNALYIIGIENYQGSKGDTIIFFLNDKIIYKDQSEFGNHILFIKEQFLYDGIYIHTGWENGMYSRTKIYYFNGNNIKIIFDFKGHVGESDIIVDDDKDEVQLIIPCKDGHAMPTDTYIYRYDKENNKFVLKKIIKRDIKDEDDPQIIERKK